MLLYFIHVHKCLYGLYGVLRFGDDMIATFGYSFCVDKNGLFNLFQAEKRQQMRQAGQRLIEMDCILQKRVWI